MSNLVLKTHIQVIFQHFASRIGYFGRLIMDDSILFIALLQRIIEMEASEQMGEADNDQRGAAHGNWRPDGSYEYIPVVEYSSHDGHSDEIIGECPKKVYVDE